MTIKKFNYVKFTIFLLIVVGIIIGIVYGVVSVVSHIKYTKTFEYKLTNIGYNEEEIKILTNKLDDKKLNDLLKREADNKIASFANEKYFIYDNLDKYLDYHKNNKDLEAYDIVAIINTEGDIDWFENEKETDTSKGKLMLVNRLYALPKDYKVEDIVDVPIKYSYDNIKLSKSLLDNLESLIEDASIEGYSFVVSSGYRTYKEQEKLYNSYVSNYGQSDADIYAAKPGHSEYETGLSFDLEPYKYTTKVNNEKESSEYLWLKDNAHKYGFIFRFESEKEHLTGFKENTWRLRYVGIDASEMIYNEDICFEEYYAFFVNGGNNYE